MHCLTQHTAVALMPCTMAEPDDCCGLLLHLQPSFRRLTAQHHWRGKEASAASLASPPIHVLTLSLGLPGSADPARPARAACCADCLTGACNDAGLPYAWINLQHGLLADDSTETNTAAAGSFTLELGLLSRLTGEHSTGPFCVTCQAAQGQICCWSASVRSTWPGSSAVACCWLRLQKPISCKE